MSNDAGFSLVPNDLSEGTVRNWIWDLCKYLDVTPTELARSAGMAPSTLNRFLARGGTGSGANLSGRTISKLQKVAVEILQTHAPRSNLERSRPLKGTSWRRIQVTASLQEGILFTEHEWSKKEAFWVEVPLPDWVERVEGFALADDHADSVYPYGSILIATPHFKLEDGDRLVVSRTEAEAGTDVTELSLRQLKISPNGDAWLVSMASEGRRPDAFIGRPEALKSGAYEIRQKVLISIRPEGDLLKHFYFPAPGWISKNSG